jgi:hypothetical protein
MCRDVFVLKMRTLTCYTLLNIEWNMARKGALTVLSPGVGFAIPSCTANGPTPQHIFPQLLVKSTIWLPRPTCTKV